VQPLGVRKLCFSPEAANVKRGQEEAQMEKKIKARVQKSKRVFVHNDLSQAAMYHADVIQEKLDKGSRDAYHVRRHGLRRYGGVHLRG
jgi:hypothetical protein